MKIMALLRISIGCLLLITACTDYRAEENRDMVIRFDSPFESELSEQRVRTMLDMYGANGSDYQFNDGVLVTDKINIAIIANKIKAYANTSESVPYFLLELGGEHEGGRLCVTQSPYDIDKTITWDSTVLRNYKQEQVKKWCSFAKPVNKFSGMNRTELKKFFNKKEDLNLCKKRGYRDGLEEDSDFIFTLLQNGFYVYIDDLSGKLCVK